MFSAADSPHDLPLYPRLQPTSRHDAVSLVMSTDEFKQRFTLGTVDNMLLDAAHDAESIYLLLEHQGMEPFIDLNVRSKKSTVSPSASEIQISPRGIPICPNAHPMKPNGSDSKLQRRKWRCTPTCGCRKPRLAVAFTRKPVMIPDCLRKRRAIRKSGSWFTSVASPLSVPTSGRKSITSLKLVGIAPR
ncbi:hypothetical protein [Paenibacillus terrae]|uniref:hypothetical protein n=1 Tax=Paenibacillus terrae TaxID=159743 RepID=UPI001F309AA3|nr:hypothetical protein [Paenibacillus terrae]